MPVLSRSARKPTISILLTIDDDGDNGRIRAVDLSEDCDDDSYEMKKKIGKQLIKKLVRAGDVDRKPNFHNSDESGCQKHKYDELMAALNSIVDRAVQNDGNRIGPAAPIPSTDDSSGYQPKSPTIRRSTTPISIISGEEIIDDDGDCDENANDDASAEERLYQYLITIQKQLAQLKGRPNLHKKPVRRHRQRKARQMDYEGLARVILKGIGLDTDNRNGNRYDYNSDENYGIVQKYPIGSMSKGMYTEDPDENEYDDIIVPDEMAVFVPTRNLTKRHSHWSRDGSNKFLDSLRKRLRISRVPDDHCVNCHTRMRRTPVNELAEAELERESTTNVDSDSKIDSDPATSMNATPEEYLLHVGNNYGIESEEGDATKNAIENTPKAMESVATTDTESGDSQSTLEPSMTGSATEPSIPTVTPSVVNGADNILNANTKTLTISQNGIQVPMRLIRNNDGQLQFVLDKKSICSNCKCKCHRRKPKPLRKL